MDSHVLLSLSVVVFFFFFPIRVWCKTGDIILQVPVQSENAGGK